MKTVTPKQLTPTEAKTAATVLKPLVDAGILPQWLPDAVKALAGDADPVRPLTPKAAAALLQVTTRTLMNWHKEGRLAAHKIGGNTTRYKLSDIEALLSGNGGAA